jgi:hypothetical protein
MFYSEWVEEEGKAGTRRGLLRFCEWVDIAPAAAYPGAIEISGIAFDMVCRHTILPPRNNLLRR